MNRIFTLITLFFLTLAASAQTDNTLQFVDRDGNVVPDGTTLTIAAEAIDDGFGDIIWEANSGLFVKNMQTGQAGSSITWTIEHIDNGAVQVCYPINCVSRDAEGTYESDKYALPAGESKSIQSEWLPLAYGQARVTYVLTAYNYNILGGYTNPHTVSTVTIIYTNTDPAGVGAVLRPSAGVRQVYSLDGRRLDGPQHGLNIIRQDNGTTIKQLIK